MPKEKPSIVFAANLWTLRGHPSPKREWSLERKIRAIKEAGFDAVGSTDEPGLGELLELYGLRLQFQMDVGKISDIRGQMKTGMALGSEVMNVQLGDHNTPLEKALPLVIRTMEESSRQEALAHLEMHRDTATETPEKTLAIADEYKRISGKMLRLNLDHSHAGIVKHLHPDEFSRRLLDRPELLQHASLLHCRPFNGHHCQIPVTDGKGKLSPEFKAYLPFVEAAFRCWLAGPRPNGELWVIPELGPLVSGYGLSCFPPVWEDCQVAMKEMRKAWTRALKGA